MTLLQCSTFFRALQFKFKRELLVFDELKTALWIKWNSNDDQTYFNSFLDFSIKFSVFQWKKVLVWTILLLCSILKWRNIPFGSKENLIGPNAFCLKRCQCYVSVICVMEWFHIISRTKQNGKEPKTFKKWTKIMEINEISWVFCRK